jgi:hypothetical protein
MTDGCNIYCITAPLEIPSARMQRAALVRATGMVRKKQAVRPLHHVQNHTCRVGEAAVLGQPSSLQPHCSGQARKRPEPEFLNFLGAQESISIPRNQFYQPM